MKAKYMHISFILHIIIYLSDVYELQINHHLGIVQLAIDICMLEEILEWRQVTVRKKRKKRKWLPFKVKSKFHSCQTNGYSGKVVIAVANLKKICKWKKLEKLTASVRHSTHAFSRRMYEVWGCLLKTVINWTVWERHTWKCALSCYICLPQITSWLDAKLYFLISIELANHTSNWNAIWTRPLRDQILHVSRNSFQKLERDPGVQSLAKAPSIKQCDKLTLWQSL